MTKLSIRVFGIVQFGHDLNGGTHYSWFQRTLVARSAALGINYTNSEIVPLQHISVLAHDPDIASCLLNTGPDEQRVLRDAVTSVQTDAQEWLEKTFETLTADIGELARFLSAIGHSVTRADSISFQVTHSDETWPPLKNKDDVETTCGKIFTDQTVREWLVDEIVRSED